jgi:glycosyltransferase involved in cell wall biosynthesis
MILGIDASNILIGGGLTHLVELLRAIEPNQYGFTKVIVWGGSKTLDNIDDREWLYKVNDDLDCELIQRLYWQRFRLKKIAKNNKCDVLFVPGGFDESGFSPVITMSQNLLPFEWRELKRFGFSLMFVRLLFLKVIQSKTFKNADGVIFLSEYAKNCVLRVTGRLSGPTPIISHGLNIRFMMKPKLQRPIDRYSLIQPYRLLYISMVTQYKHQWHLVKAVSVLRTEGIPVALDLVGPSYPSSLKKLENAIKLLDPEGSWVSYHGAIPYNQLHEMYAHADLGVFASSCENLPIILLETMAAGLPVACSNRGPMPEILQDAGVYFNPEDSDDIVHALKALIGSPELRAQLSQNAYTRAKEYSWKRCAHETFSFLSQIAHCSSRVSDEQQHNVVF